MRYVLLEQFSRYPRMQVEDVVKLLYQSEFGGGHMIANPQKSLDFLKREWESGKQGTKWEKMPENAAEKRTEKKPEAPWEFIGDGMYRMNLTALDDGISPETMNQMFVQTADRKVGTVAGFEKKLNLLRECCQRGELPFETERLEQYLEAYRKQGYPAVSHSATYREAYHPAYRVVADSFIRYYHVLREIDSMLRRRGWQDWKPDPADSPERTMEADSTARPVTVAIDGMCGSGKSTMGRVLQGLYPCNLVHMDDYFLRPEQRTAERMAEVGGNVDYERFQEEILAHMKEREGLRYRVYDCGSQSLGQPVWIPWWPLLLVEGSYSQHPYFGDAYDLRVFCEIGGEEQLRSIVLRIGAAMAERFQKEWNPSEQAYFEKFGIREKSICIRGI